MGLLDFLKTKNPLEELEKIEISYNLSGALSHHSLKKVHVGDLLLPSGRIIASDPFYTHSQRPFVRSVEPGKYPVNLFAREMEEDHYRIAFAQLKVKPEKATKWILAITEDLNPADVYDMDDEEYFGFTVEAGLGCFLDVQTNEEYLRIIDEFYAKNPDLNYYDDVLAEEFDQYSSHHQYSRDLGDWNNHHPNKTSEANIIMFASGWGDGYYPSYWGLNDHKEIVELTVDFMLDYEGQATE